MTDHPDRSLFGDAAPGMRWLDWTVALGPVAGLILLAILTAEDPRSVNLSATLLFVVVPLSIRRFFPIPVLLVVATGALLTSVRSPVPWVEVCAVGLASFTVGERAGDRTRSALVVLAVTLFMALGFLAQDTRLLEGLVLPFAVLIPTWLLGDIVRGRRIETQRRAEAVAQAMREREARLEAAALEERRHVARELHDVVAHAVSVMVIQAGAARQVVRTSPEQAEQSMLAIESVGRDAMTELRRFLGALSDDDEAAGIAPQPGIDALPTLVDRVREAGLAASLQTDGAPRAVPASLDVTVYRIVQEALTNALRYAREAATLVHVSWEPDQLRVEILDDGPATAPGEGSGRGLVGMRERASLVGGRLEAGPRVGGGYAVRAWLPLDPGAVALKPDPT
ncbi:MAG TPA: sensor histidine kinase [Candidatus Limnocylindrales bacterium]|jgi:signal transduction histidine kinase|nr:sensor histidine kinase [Candidatus Limnocylindrales bacterium]